MMARQNQARNRNVQIVYRYATPDFEPGFNAASAALADL
jgi:hypothetical protein